MSVDALVALAIIATSLVGSLALALVLVVQQRRDDLAAAVDRHPAGRQLEPELQL